MDFNQPISAFGQNVAYPFSESPPRYKNFYLYSWLVAPLSGESFTLFLPEVNTDMMNIFFDELSKEYPDKEIIIAMDQAGWHKAKDLKLPCDRVHLSSFIFTGTESVEKLWQWLRKNNPAMSSSIRQNMMDALEQEIRRLTSNELAQLCHCSYYDITRGK